MSIIRNYITRLLENLEKHEASPRRNGLRRGLYEWTRAMN